MTTDLLAHWQGPNSSRLTPRQFSLRLPVEVHAMISVLCEMYPKRSRTEIIGDLLSEALSRLVESMPTEMSKSERDAAEAAGVDPDDLDQDSFGRGRFLRLVKKYEEELEAEIAGSDTEGAGQVTRYKEVAKRAPRGRGASATATAKARPADGPRGDQPDRQRGGRRRPVKG